MSEDFGQAKEALLIAQLEALKIAREEKDEQIKVLEEETAQRVEAFEAEVQEIGETIVRIDAALTAIRAAREKLIIVGPLDGTARPARTKRRPRQLLKKLIIDELELERDRGGLTIQELVARTGAKPGSVRSFLFLAVKDGWIVRDNTTQRYRLLRQRASGTAGDGRGSADAAAPA